MQFQLFFDYAAIVLQRPERIRCYKTFADALAA